MDEKKRAELVKTVAEALTALVDSEVKRDKEETRGFVRRDGGRVVCVYSVADMIVETVVTRLTKP